MSIARTFLLRMVGSVLVCSGIAVLFLRDSWAEASAGGVIAAVSWAAFASCLMGVAGFQSLRKALVCRPQALMSVVMLGLIGRLFVLAASQALVYGVFGSEWGRRTLLVTTALYGLVLGVEVLTLYRALQSGELQRTVAESSVPDETSKVTEDKMTEGNAEE